MLTEQGSRKTFFATFVEQNGEAATVSGTPTITVVHREGSNTITDVSAQNMTTLAGIDSTYYFTRSFGASAFKGSYTAIYEATYDTGQDVIHSEDFNIVDKGAFSSRVGGFTSKIIQVFSDAEKNKLMKAARDVDRVSGTITKSELVKDVARIKAILGNMGGNKKKIEKLAEKIDGSRKVLKGEMHNLYNKVKELDVKNKDLEFLLTKSLSDEALEESILNESKVIIGGVQDKAKKGRKAAE